MNLKGTLVKIATVIAEEAARNPDFHARLEAILVTDKVPSTRPPAASGTPSPGQRSDESRRVPEKRRGGRRSPAVIDPIDLVTHGETALRDQLANLDLELLYDVVAQYGMDPGKLVMKWRDRDRVIDRIVEVALVRSTKGDAFRKE